MPQISQCPECGKRLRIPEERMATVVKCRGCGQRFRAAEAAGPDGLRRSSAVRKKRTHENDSVDEDLCTAPAHDLMPRRKSGRRNGAMQPFLRRWLIACGVILALAALVGAGGFFSEALALAACLICGTVVLCCAMAGTVWMALDLGRENFFLGLGVLFMPAIGLGLAFRNKGPALRGAVVFASAVPPTLLMGLMVLVFRPMYDGSGRQAANAARCQDLLHRMDDQFGPNTPVVSVTMRVASRPGGLDGVESQGEVLLGQFKSYVPG